MRRRVATAVLLAVTAIAACDDDSALPPTTSPAATTTTPTSAAPPATGGPPASDPATTTPAAPGPVIAGPLTAVPGDGTWSLAFEDSTAAVLTSSSSHSPLRITTDDGTFAATDVISTEQDGETYVATVATDAPDGRPITVRLHPAGDGTIAVTVDGGRSARRVAATFDVPTGEQFYGLGQRAGPVDHRGETVVNTVRDGPWTGAQADVVENLVPAPGFSRRRDATYFPVPWMLSSRGYGVLVDNDETSRFRFATQALPGAWDVEVDASQLVMRVVAGPTPAEALARMTAALGRQPPAAAPFYFGPWWQADEDEASELAAIRRAGVPVSLAQTYTHYLPCGDHEGRRDEERERVRRMHDAGLAVTTYVNPMVCASYDGVYQRGVTDDAFTRRPDGEPYTYHYSTATEFDVSQFDFSTPAGRDLFHDVLAAAVDAGYDGWMEDFGEYTPRDAVSADATPGAVMHNRYVEQYHAAAHDYASRVERPLARFNRSGWTEAIATAQIVWGGDPTTSWGFDGLRSAVRSGLGMGLSGVSLWGSDIGGFFTWPGDGLTPELLRRWIQFGAFSGVMRLQAGGISITAAERATVLDRDVLPVWRRYSHLRTRLYPYIAGAEETYDATGMPLMRHPVLTDPGSEAAQHGVDEYLFGADMLVAPVVAPGARRRDVVLPPGRWVDLWRSATIDRRGEIALGRAQISAGDSVVNVAAPAAEIPLHVRVGAVLPLLPPGVDTLSEYGSAPGLVHLRDVDDRRVLVAFPGDDWSGPLGPGEAMRSTSDATRWTLDINGSQPRTYEVEASLAGLDPAFVACDITLDGERVPYSFDDATRVLRLTAEPVAAKATIEVTAC